MYKVLAYIGITGAMGLAVLFSYLYFVLRFGPTPTSRPILGPEPVNDVAADLAKLALDQSLKLVAEANNAAMERILIDATQVLESRHKMSKRDIVKAWSDLRFRLMAELKGSSWMAARK